MQTNMNFDGDKSIENKFSGQGPTDILTNTDQLLQIDHIRPYQTDDLGVVLDYVIADDVDAIREEDIPLFLKPTAGDDCDARDDVSKKSSVSFSTEQLKST